MIKKSPISNYLLRYDFSKKVMFILGFTIVASIILFISLLMTYHGLKGLMEKQLIGIEYHHRLISIYETIINFQSQLYSASNKKDKDQFKAQLITSLSEFSSIVTDLSTYIKDHSINHTAFYLERLEQYEKNFQNAITGFQQGELNQVLNNLEINDLLTKLKRELLTFGNTISTIFDLHLYTNPVTGLQLDFITHRLPAYQNDLSQLLSINPAHLTSKKQAEMYVDQIQIDQNLNNLLTSYQSILKNREKITFKKNQPFEKFLTSAVKFNHTLSAKIFEKKELKKSWAGLRELGIESLQDSIKMYNFLSQKIKTSLSSEHYEYYCRELVSTLLFFIGAFLILTPYVLKAFRRPLADLQKAAEKLTQGDLSVRIPYISYNEVGAVSKSFNETVKVFQQIMQETDRFANDLSDHSSKIFLTAKQIEKNLGMQEKIFQFITKLSKNILKTVEDFSDSLDQANDTVRLTVQQVNLSRDSLSELEVIVQHMGVSAENTVDALSSIKSEIDKITLVINTLITIADQINLLSLNTSIRSSKTGLKKLGYSIIAEKISELADQTANATLDMEQIVQAIHSIVPEIVKDIDQFSHEIQYALEESIALREQFQQLLTLTQTQIASFHTINQGMQDQAEKTLKIDQSINGLSQSSQKTTQLVRGLYIEIENLHLSTQKLLEMTQRFTESKEKQEVSR